jgi:hypothetical protein
VRDLDQVVDFGSSTDNGPSQRRTIYCRVGPDFHIVLNVYNPHLRYLDPFSPLTRITKSIGADHYPCMEDDPIAETTIFKDRNLRMKDTVLSHLHSVS